MKIPKHQWEEALKEMQDMVLRYGAEQSFANTRSYDPKTTTEAQSAYAAGMVNGAAAFLRWAEKQAEGMYKRDGSRTE